MACTLTSWKEIGQHLGKGVRTADIRLPGTATVSTAEMGKALIAELEAAAR